MAVFRPVSAFLWECKHCTTSGHKLTLPGAKSAARAHYSEEHRGTKKKE